MLVDGTSLQSAPSTLAEVAVMPCPRFVEELRTFLGVTGYLRQFMEKGSIVATALTDIFCTRDLASESTRRSTIPRDDEDDRARQSLNQALASSDMLALPDRDNTCDSHTDGTEVGAGGVLISVVDDYTRIVLFASHRLSH